MKRVNEDRERRRKGGTAKGQSEVQMYQVAGLMTSRGVVVALQSRHRRLGTTLNAFLCVPLHKLQFVAATR